MKTATLTTVLALMATLTPVAAEAKDRDRRDRHPHRERHRGGKDDAVGGFVLGALLAGGIAVALSAKKPAPVVETAYEPAPPSETDADAAVAACAAAAEGEGRRTFALAQAGIVTAVDPDGDGFAIQGDLLLRGGYRDAAEHRIFRCSVDSQAVRRIAIDGLPLAPSFALP